MLNPRRRPWFFRPSTWLTGSIAALALGFAAHAQQQKPEAATPAGPSAGIAGKPATKPKAAADPGPTSLPGQAPAEPLRDDEQEMGDAEDLTDKALQSAVNEAEAEGQKAADSLDGGVHPDTQEVLSVPAAAANAVVQHATHLPGLSLWRKAKLIGKDDKGNDARYEATSAEGKKVRLTIDPKLQAQMEKLLKMYRPMEAAVVALDPRTGRVLAIAEHAEDGKADGLAIKPLYPAASVFKIITGAALLEKGISPDAETCFHGGMHGIVGKLLLDSARLDRRCLSLSMALAKSANVVFAKMAVKHLDGNELRKEAERFLFNTPMWDQPVEQSTAKIPDSGLDFAKSAAGFGQVKLSPLHAALIAGAVANGGVAFEPTLVDSVDGEPEQASASRRLLKAETAIALRDMMKLTVSEGTASSSFRDHRRAILGEITVAGKTGSLSNHERPFKDYSWFVGFAPADDPKIAVAAVVVNGLKWRIHAPFVAREALRAYLVGGGIGQPPVARARPRRRRQHR